MWTVKQKMRKLLVAFSIVCLGMLYFFNPFSQSRFAHIPQNEKQTLERFLGKLLFKDQFAYVLFGEKAIAIDIYVENESAFDRTLSYKEKVARYLHDLIYDKSILLMNSCFEITKYEMNVFRKYKPSFQSDNFLLIESNVKEHMKRLLFINKKKLFHVIQEHQMIFRKILGKSFTVKKLYKEICSGKQDILKTLKYHEGLFGCLLGFGQKNSFCYHKRNNLLNKICTYPQPPHDRKKLHIKGKFFATYEEERDYLINLLSMPPYTLNRSCILQFVHPVFFAAKNSRETQKLVKQYEKALSKISSECAGRKVLDIVSEKFRNE